ncbi:MAG: hypothetical protein WCO44_05825 [Bacteroidota bacterium]
MRLKAGTRKPTPVSPAEDNYTGSMAEAMQQAFEDEWANVMGDMPQPQPSDQMQLLFVAIARGIVRHLFENPQAFTVHVNTGSGDGTVNGIVTVPSPPLSGS